MDTILIGLERGERTEDDLVAMCQGYFDQHKNKLYAFNDLRGVLQAREDSLVQRVVQYCMNSVDGKSVSAKPTDRSEREAYPLSRTMPFH
jgi:N-terminal acetyltransferase B complex non-catalytic subunit